MTNMRDARLAILASHKRTGEILIAAKMVHGDFGVGVLIEKYHISNYDADCCIDLFNNWEQVMAAEQWGYNQGWSTPSTADDALDLLPPWLKAHHLMH